MILIRALDHLLFQLHVGDAVHQKAAGAVLPLVNGDGMAPLVQVVGHGQARRPEPMTATLLPVRAGGGDACTQPLA